MNDGNGEQMAGQNVIRNGLEKDVEDDPIHEGFSGSP